MTICYFSAQYLPTAGGVERYTWNLARRAVRAGHRAIVITSALPDLPAREVDADGIEILRLPVFPLMGGRFPVLRPGPLLSRLKREIFSQPIDLCVIQTRMYSESLWAAHAAARYHRRALVIDHSTGYMPVGGGLLSAAGRQYEQFVCRSIAKTGVPFYGVSRDSCIWLNTFGVTAAGELPNAVDPAALAALAADSPEPWRARLCPNGEKLVVFLGRMIPEKGIGELAAAAGTMPGVVLAAAGTGPALEHLRDSAPHNVVYTGALPYRETIQLLSQADAYCLPTRYAEGFPTTLLEAAACRCPIVCTRTAGTAELMPGDGYGILLTDTSAQTIRAALSRLLNDAALRRSCAENARRNLEKHFTWDIVSAKILSIAQAQS